MSLELYKEKSTKMKTSDCINVEIEIRSPTESLVCSFKVGLEANVVSVSTSCLSYGFLPFH